LWTALADREASPVPRRLPPPTVVSPPSHLICEAVLPYLFVLGRHSSDLRHYPDILTAASALAAACQAHPVLMAWMPIARLLAMRASSYALVA
jgi:hypothetical protein